MRETFDIRADGGIPRLTGQAVNTNNDNIWIRTFDLFTTPKILSGAAALMLVTTLLLYAVHMMQLPPLEGSNGQTKTGDYFAFYSGAEMVSRGLGGDLFNLDAQQALQHELAGEGEWAEWNAYLNPPGFAILLALFAPLGFHGSFFAYDALCVLLFALAAASLKPHLPQLTRTPARTLLTLLAVLSLRQVSQPMLMGQNTTITLSLLGLAYAAHRSNRPVALGIALGLLSYKPQFLLPLLPFFVLRKEWLAVGVAATVSLLHYAIGALVCGWDWPWNMLDALQGFVPDQRAAQVHMSLPGAADVLFSPPLASLVTLIGCAAVVWVWLRAFRQRAWERQAFGAGWALLVLGCLLISPHLNYYDSGVMVLPVLLLVEHRLTVNSEPFTRGERLWLLLLWGAYPSWSLAEHLPVQPLLFVLLGAFVWAARLVQRGTEGALHEAPAIG